MPKSLESALFIKSLTISFGVLTLCPLAQAQSTAQPSEVQAIYACKSIAAAAERLACYDKSVGRLEAAEKSGEVLTISKEAIEKVEKDAFGFNIPSLPSLSRIFGREEKSRDNQERVNKENALTEPVKEATRKNNDVAPSKPPVLNTRPKPSIVDKVALEIRKVTEFGYKKKRFIMSNGQVWEQIGTSKIRIPKLKDGQNNTAHIRNGAVGSFLLQINGNGAAIRVRRVR